MLTLGTALGSIQIKGFNIGQQRGFERGDILGETALAFALGTDRIAYGRRRICFILMAH